MFLWVGECFASIAEMRLHDKNATCCSSPDLPRASVGIVILRGGRRSLSTTLAKTHFRLILRITDYESHQVHLLFNSTGAINSFKSS